MAVMTVVWFLIATNILMTEGLICLNCDSVINPLLCEHTIQCLNGSVCGIERFISSGDILYKLGCMSTSRCHTARSSINRGIETCRECCTSDGCNIDGCGANSLNIKRGPLCYNCDGIDNPSHCHQVRVCEEDEVCFTQETFRWNIKLWKTSCENIHVCKALTGVLPIVGRRKRSVLCSKCCANDLCNQHCGENRSTTSDHGPIHTTNQVTLTSTDTPSTPTRTTRSLTTYSTKSPMTTISSAKGYREYFVMFMESYRMLQAEPILFIYSQQTGTVKIHCIICNQNYTIQLTQGYNNITLPRSVFTTDGTSVKGVYVTATVPIVLYGMNSHHVVSDGYLSIPLQFISTEYIIPSYTVNEPSNSDFNSMFGIVATEDKTDVSITFKIKTGTLMLNSKTYHNGDTANVTLSKFETLQISHAFDLSGSIVNASRPIGVLSGSKCDKLSKDAYCSAFTEMILPSNQLDNNYIFPAVQRRDGSLIRVFCNQDTVISVKTMQNSTTTLQRKGQFFEFTYNGMSFINSSNDVLVMLYANDKEPHMEDSFMMTIVGIQQYKSSYDFIVPAGYTTNFISITMQSQGIHDFILDNQELNMKITNVYNMTVNRYIYTSFSYQITTGGHVITHKLNKTFGLWVYGERDDDGYGFPAGMAFKVKNN